MARLVGIALSLLLATVAQGDDTSALLQVDTETVSLQTALAALRSLSAIAKKHEREVEPELDMGVVGPHVANATKFIVKKLSTVTRKTGNQSCGTLCVTSILIDSMSILYEAFHGAGWAPEPCGTFIILVWWVTGLLTMTRDQKLTFPEAIHVLMQQETSVGYGSSGQEDSGIKIFHALHGVLSQLGVKKANNEVFDWALGQLAGWLPIRGTSSPARAARASILFAFVFGFTAALFGLDLGNDHSAVDAIYGTLITASTIGYGDISWTHAWAKLLSPLTVPLLTQSFANWTETMIGNQGTSREFASLAVCKCSWFTLCHENSR